TTAKVGDKNGEDSTIYLEENKMRVDSNRDPEHKTVFIYDVDKQMGISENQQKKTFTEITPCEFKAGTTDAQNKRQGRRSKMTPEQKKRMEGAMGQMAPEERKRMQEMMAGRMRSEDSSAPLPRAKWERTGSDQKVAGYSCHGFKEIRDGKTAATGCYIPWSG